jgi:hypothetical protein
MAQFKVFDEEGKLLGDYPSRATMLLNLRKIGEGVTWVEDEDGNRSLFIITAAGIAHLTPHIIELVQRGLKTQLAEAQKDAIDASKWRAFIGSGRIRVLGVAGLVPNQPSYGTPYAHMGLEVWSSYLDADPAETERSRQFLEAYVAKLSGAPCPEAIIQNMEA